MPEFKLHISCLIPGSLSPALILAISALGYHTVAMVKKSKKIYYEFEEKHQSVKDIFKASTKHRGRSRYLLSVSVMITHKDGGRIPARLVFVRNRSNRNDCPVILSTDMSMNFRIFLYRKLYS